MNARAISWTLLMVCGSAMAGEQLVCDLVWSDLEASGRLQQGQVQTEPESAVEEFLRVENTESSTKTVPILVLESPGVTELNYMIRGKIRYRGVQGTGYLEMWNHFPGGGQYFTRTLGDQEPMKKIQGDADWHAVALPFQGSAEVGPPQKLVVSVVLAGPGVVDIGPLQLLETKHTNIFTAASGGWWGLSGAIALGAGGGTLLGVIGATIGVLSSLGVARRFVLLLAYGTAMVGVVLIGVGIAALTASQPFFVAYPALLLGVLAVCIMGPLSVVLRRRFEAIELRKVSALDVR